MRAEQKRIQQIAEMAAYSLRNHTLRCNLDRGLFRNWTCSDGTSAYRFNISTEPGRLLVSGDVGELLLERYWDMLHWARTAVRDIHYFHGKCVPSIKTREWDAACAREWVLCERRQERREQCGMTAALARDLYDAASDSEHAFFTELTDSGYCDGSDYPDCDNYTHSFLWCREALRWLLTRLPEHADWQI